MKFLIAFAAVMAVAQAQYLRDFGAVVEGPKTIIAGPSGVITADTGSIVKAPETRGFIASTIPATRLIGSPLLASRSVIGAPLLGAPLLDHGLLGARSFGLGYDGLLGARSLGLGYGGLLY